MFVVKHKYVLWLFPVRNVQSGWGPQVARPLWGVYSSSCPCPHSGVTTICLFLPPLQEWRFFLIKPWKLDQVCVRIMAVLQRSRCLSPTFHRRPDQYSGRSEEWATSSLIGSFIFCPHLDESVYYGHGHGTGFQVNHAHNLHSIKKRNKNVYYIFKHKMIIGEKGHGKPNGLEALRHPLPLHTISHSREKKFRDLVQEQCF